MGNIFKRYEGNPILAPTENRWEKRAVLNAAAIKVQSRILKNAGYEIDETKEEQIVLVYRAIGEDNISRFGLAISGDGYNFKRFDQPILQPEQYSEFETMGIEDPRICYFDDAFHIVYVSASLYPPNHPKPEWSIDRAWRIRISLAKTTDFKKFERDGVVLADIDSKDPILFPERINDKIYIFHREFPNIWACSGQSWYRWDENKIVARIRPGMWDGDRIGVGGTPIKTSQGWLLIYHGVDDKHVYRQGAMLLDLNDPTRVIARSKEPFLEPSLEYEKSGVVGNVVFSCGSVENGDELLMYYGAGDRVLCVGTASINELIASLEPVEELVGVGEAR